MIDWNGNGRIDPVDIGISIAAQEETDKPHRRKRPNKNGCLTTCIGTLLIIIGFAVLLIVVL